MIQPRNDHARGFLLEQRVTWTDLERERRSRQAIAELRRQLREATDHDDIELILLKLRSLKKDCENLTIV